jgi:SAM-dependent methyltransferase
MVQVYTRSARIYDMIYAAAGWDYAGDAAAIDALVRGRCHDARTLLDVACGTGRHLSFLRDHYDVEGVDIDLAMVEQARRALPRVPVWVGDMRTLELGREFDVVTCLFGAIGHLLEDSELQDSITRMANHLVAGGVLVIDGWFQPQDWTANRPPSTLSAEDGDVRVVRMDRTTRDGDFSLIEMHHLIGTLEQVEYFREDHVLRLRPDAVIVAAMEATGLRVEVVSGALRARSRFIGVMR